MSDDSSPGDSRKPYSDIGGPEARHAETHDVRREQLTNPTGPEPYDASFDEQLHPNRERETITDANMDTTPADHDKRLKNRLDDRLSPAEMRHLAFLDTGTPLEQGGTYLDLNDMDRGAFRAIGSDRAEAHQRIVAKRDLDPETWNRLVGQNEHVQIDRPS